MESKSLKIKSNISNMSLKIKIAVGGILAFVPMFAHAQTGTTIFSVVNLIETLVARLVPIAIAAALLFFIWGLAVFIKNSGSDEGREEGKQKMIWGIVALFIIVAVWGIVWFVANTFRINPEMRAPVPDIPRTVGGTTQSPSNRTTTSRTESGTTQAGGGTTAGATTGSGSGSTGSSDCPESSIFGPSTACPNTTWNRN